MATPAERRAREREELRTHILDRARDLFVRFGYEGVTLRKVAQAVAYAPGTIYSYFRDKDDLIRALCQADWETFERSFPRDDATLADPIEAIRAMGAGYAKFALEHPNHYRLLFMTPQTVVPDEEVLAKRGDPARDGYALLHQSVERAQAARLLRPEFGDPALVAQTLWAAIHGVVSLTIARGHDQWVAWTPVEQRVQTMLTVMLDGLVRHGASEAAV